MEKTVKIIKSKNLLKHHDKEKVKENNVNVNTHLYLNKKGLRKIPKLNLNGVVVYYLHNNNIKEIENIESSSIINLYLQYNEIKKIENINANNLQKLYLGNNNITVVEQLSHLDNLLELHIEKQRVPPGTSLCFDPRSITSIAKSLQVLNISENEIDSLKCLLPLRHLRVIIASNNKLHDIDELCEVLKAWFYLQEAWFMGNPISKKHRYREDIIASTYCLESLDNKPITDLTRTFIKSFENKKLSRSSKASVNFADTHKNLPKNYPPPLQKAVSQSLIHNKLHILGPLDTCMDDALNEQKNLKQKKRNAGKAVKFNTVQTYPTCSTEKNLQ